MEGVSLISLKSGMTSFLIFGIEPAIIFLGTRLVEAAAELLLMSPVPKLIGIGVVRL